MKHAAVAVWVGYSVLSSTLSLGQSPEAAAGAAHLANAKAVTVPVKEPSGLAVHEKRNSVLLVGDEGVLVELGFDLTEKNRWTIDGDLEAVTVHPLTGTALIAAEREAVLIEFDLDLGRELRRLTLALGSHPEFLEDRDPNRGLEGLALVASGEDISTYVAHEMRPPRVVKLRGNLTAEATRQARESTDPPPAQYIAAEKAWDFGLRTLNDLAYDRDTDTFLLVGARDKTLLVLDRAFKELRRIELPGPYPEGVCLLPNGDGLVVHDAGGGHVIPGLRSVLYPRP